MQITRLLVVIRFVTVPAPRGATTITFQVQLGIAIEAVLVLFGAGAAAEIMRPAHDHTLARG